MIHDQYPSLKRERFREDGMGCLESFLWVAGGCGIGILAGKLIGLAILRSMGLTL